MAPHQQKTARVPGQRSWGAQQKWFSRYRFELRSKNLTGSRVIRSSDKRVPHDNTHPALHERIKKKLSATQTVLKVLKNAIGFVGVAFIVMGVVLALIQYAAHLLHQRYTL